MSDNVRGEVGRLRREVHRMGVGRAATPPATRPLADYAHFPLLFAASYWPGVRFYDRQEEVIQSVVDNEETVVVAAHQVGKDFVAGFVAVWFFVTRWPVRVICTSCRDDHLRVLFSEMQRFVTTAAYPLTRDQGGPLIVSHREYRRLGPDGGVCPVSYLRGMVSEKGEGMQGHHAEHTLFVVDEASGVEDVTFQRADTWAKRKLVIGNPYGTSGWFYDAVKGGDVAAKAEG